MPGSAPTRGNEPTQLVAPTEGLLRFSTAGSVDDGKSTLIGRLLYDSQSVLEDQLASVRKSNVNRSSGPIDFALLTDGLRAEREQGITIDVAYRYFSTPRRKFIIADTPGHEQYTRNMATGASTADASVVLMDATKGRAAPVAPPCLHREPARRAAHHRRREQNGSRRLFAGSVRAHRRRISRVCRSSSACRMSTPCRSARSKATTWSAAARACPGSKAPRCSNIWKSLRVSDTAAAARCDFPVQYVIRPDATFRGFAGQIASGDSAPGNDTWSPALGREDESQIDRQPSKTRLEQAGPGESGERHPRR